MKRWYCRVQEVHHVVVLAKFSADEGQLLTRISSLRKEQSTVEKTCRSFYEGWHEQTPKTKDSYKNSQWKISPGASHPSHNHIPPLPVLLLAATALGLTSYVLQKFRYGNLFGEAILMPVLSIYFFFFSGVWSAKHDRLTRLVSLPWNSWSARIVLWFLPVVWTVGVGIFLLVDAAVMKGKTMRGICDMLGRLLLYDFPEPPEVGYCSCCGGFYFY